MSEAVMRAGTVHSGLVYQHVYGITLASDEAIPGVESAGDGNADIRVHIGSMPDWLDDTALHSHATHIYPLADVTDASVVVRRMDRDGEYHFEYDDGIRFLITSTADEVWLDWPSSATLDAAAMYLLGPIMTWILRLRGTPTLHASVFAVNGHAVLLVGGEGAGKSTTAAALANRGIPVLSDDLAPIEGHADGHAHANAQAHARARAKGAPPHPNSVTARGESIADEVGLRIRAGYSRLRLWPDSAHALFANSALTPLAQGWDKLGLDLHQDGLAFEARTLPLGAVYLLGSRTSADEAPWIQDLSPREALLGLVANSAAGPLLDTRMRAEELALMGHIVRELPVRRVVPHASHTRLSELCDLLVNDASSRIG